MANYAVGFDNVDLEATAARYIPVGNTPDVLTDATADLAFALILAAARRIPRPPQDARTGVAHVGAAGWLGADVHGATLGIVGAGRIGQAVAKRATGFEMGCSWSAGRRPPPSPRTSGLRLNPRAPHARRPAT